MLDKLKEIRIDLESKLASITTENHYLKKQLYTAEAERDKVSGLLEAKEREINVLRRHITLVNNFLITNNAIIVRGNFKCKIN